MFIEVRFSCRVAKSGYEFDEYGRVRPRDCSRGFKDVSLDEIAVFHFSDLFEYLDEDYHHGLPSRTEQQEILRFYNNWGFLEFTKDEEESACLLIRSMRDFWDTSAFAPIQVDLREDGRTLVARPKTLSHALGIAKFYADSSRYTTCEYFLKHNEPRGRRNGSCPPSCRVKKQKGASWGKGCQRNSIMKNDREKGFRRKEN